MNLQLTLYENQRLREVAREYRKRGYEVLVEPSPAQLPSFLAPFRIDLLARNDEETVVIEVRTQGSLTSAPELDAIARVLQHRPQWRFELVVTNPRDRDALRFADATSLGMSEIVLRLQEARELSDDEHGEAALLLAWSATEALLRYIADAEAIQVRSHSPAQVIKSLYTYGVLDMEQYEVLQAGLETRNRLIHGYREQRSLMDVVARLLGVAEELRGQHLY
jgi:uncharacterized protein YutE (UPF0331/DUF86 family)